MPVTKLASGVFWSLLMRWSIKFIGLINTIILARLLTPDDFGIVAMAMLVIGLIQELSTVNISLLLIRTTSTSPKHANTAWTVGILQSLLVMFVLFILAPYASEYFQDERIIAVIYILSISKLLMGLRNIGLILARKQLDFFFDYKFMVVSRLITFFSVITLAIMENNYWAIVYGTLISELIIVFLSYYMHPYRPSICFTHFKEYIRFATIMIPMAISKLLNNKFDVLVVGGVGNTSLTGLYNLANEISSLFTVELVLPITRGLFPNFSKLQNNKTKFIKVYLLVISGAMTVCLPIGAGLYLIAEDFIYILLGAQWLDSVVYIKWLVMYGTATCIIILASEHPLIALGMEKTVNKLMWLRLAVLIVSVLIGHQIYGIEGVAMGMFVSVLFNLPIVLLYVFNRLGLQAMDIITCIWKPVVSIIPMIISGQLLETSLADAHIIFRLFIVVLTCSSLYTLTQLILWKLSGQPDGIEKYLVNIVLPKLKNIIKG